MKPGIVGSALLAGLAACLLLAAGCNSATKPAAAHIKIPIIAARTEDVSTVDGMVRADYESISGAIGVPRQWGRDLSLYDPHARFVAVGSDPKTGAVVAKSFNEQEYVERSDANFVNGGYMERELAHRIQSFGNVATILSSYEGKYSLAGKASSRGVNIYQLYFDGKRWWILSVVWDEERPDNPIPLELLPSS
jgi:hypothetical protein